MKTSQAIQEFITSRGTLRPGTQRVYRSHLALFQAAFPRGLPQKPLPIQEWLNSFSHLRPETVASRFATVRALYNDLCRLHRLKNPMPLVRPPRILPQAMRIFTEGELYALFNLPLSARDRALLTLLLDTGVRRGEAAGLTWPDMRPEYIVVRGKTGERVVPVSHATMRLLQALRRASEATDGQHVFQGKQRPLTAHGIYQAVRRLCQHAGINGRRASPHTFRATFATMYSAADGSDPQVLQRILGHQTFSTTLRYINASQRHVLDNHRLCTPLRGLEALAQGRLIKDQEEAVQEAEGILARREE